MYVDVVNIKMSNLYLKHLLKPRAQGEVQIRPRGQKPLTWEDAFKDRNAKYYSKLQE